MGFKTDKRIALLCIGRGGWTGHHRRVDGSSVSASRTEHYGETWRDHDFTPDAVAVDTTTIPEADIVTFAVAGPMVDVNLKPGMVSKFGAVVAFDPRPSFDRGSEHARFGNAWALDLVAVDVYVRLAESFGARVFDPTAAEAVA